MSGVGDRHSDESGHFGACCVAAADSPIAVSGTSSGPLADSARHQQLAANPGLDRSGQPSRPAVGSGTENAPTAKPRIPQRGRAPAPEDALSRAKPEWRPRFCAISDCACARFMLLRKREHWYGVGSAITRVCAGDEEESNMTNR